MSRHIKSEFFHEIDRLQWWARIERMAKRADEIIERTKPEDTGHSGTCANCGMNIVDFQLAGLTPFPDNTDGIDFCSIGCYDEWMDGADSETKE